MKKQLLFLAMAIFFLAGVPAALLAQNEEASTTGQNDELEAAIAKSATDKQKREVEDSKAALDRMMRFAKARNYDGFGKMMIYSGRDPNRTMRVKMNPKDAHEGLEIENTLNYVHHWLSKSAFYHAKRYRKVKGLSGDLFFWDVEFTTLKGKLKMFKAVMAKLGDEYLFVRMEKG
ncbi:MAG: hypothetical protein AAGN35_11135 [Bacteroidota bacterium]